VADVAALVAILRLKIMVVPLYILAAALYAGNLIVGAVAVAIPYAYLLSATYQRRIVP